MLFLALWFTFSYLPIAHMVWWWGGPARRCRLGLPVRPRRLRLRRRHRGAHQCRCRRSRRRHRAWAAQGLHEGADPAAQPDLHLHRRLPAVGRLVRLQRRLQPRSQRPHRPGPAQHHHRDRRLRRWPGPSPKSSPAAMPSLLGAASGAVAGLVAITPAAGFAGTMGAIVLGAVAGVVCLWAVVTLKPMFKYDDASTCSASTASAASSAPSAPRSSRAPSLGGFGLGDPTAYSIGSQFMIQLHGGGHRDRLVGRGGAASPC